MHNRDPRKRWQRKGDWKCIWRNHGLKFPKSKYGNRYQDTGSTEVSNMMNPNRPIPRHIIIKTAKFKHKERTLKAAREKQSKLQGNPYKAMSWFLFRVEWQDTFKVLKGKIFQPRILYPARLLFKIGDINNLSEKQKQKQYNNTKPIHKEILKGLL